MVTSSQSASPRPTHLTGLLLCRTLPSDLQDRPTRRQWKVEHNKDFVPGKGATGPPAKAQRVQGIQAQGRHSGVSGDGQREGALWGAASRHCAGKESGGWGRLLGQSPGAPFPPTPGPEGPWAGRGSGCKISFLRWGEEDGYPTDYHCPAGESSQRVPSSVPFMVLIWVRPPRPLCLSWQGFCVP